MHNPPFSCLFIEMYLRSKICIGKTKNTKRPFCESSIDNRLLHFMKSLFPTTNDSRHGIGHIGIVYK